MPETCAKQRLQPPTFQNRIGDLYERISAVRTRQALRSQNLAWPSIAAAREPLDDFGNVSPIGLLGEIAVQRETNV
jgi:hypothetical protein